MPASKSRTEAGRKEGPSSWTNDGTASVRTGRDSQIDSGLFLYNQLVALPSA